MRPLSDQKGVQKWSKNGQTPKIWGTPKNDPFWNSSYRQNHYYEASS